MSNFLGLFYGGADQFTALAATFALFALFSFLGGLLGGRTRIPGSEPFFGWAAAVIFMTVVPVWTGIHFTLLFWIVVVIAGISALILQRREAKILPSGFHRLIVLASPMLLLCAAMTASQWDEFSHWLTSIGYLIDNDSYPGLGMPESQASYPGYPYGWPLVGYMAAKLGNGYIEGMAPVANILFLGAFGMVLTRLIKQAIAGQTISGSQQIMPGWIAVGFGFLGATALSTIFIEKLILTAYADTLTSAATGLTAVLAWAMIEAAIAGSKRGAAVYAWQISLIGGGLILVKQANLVLFALVMIAAFLILARLRVTTIAQWAKLAMIAFVVPIGVYLSWRHHVSTELAGKEFLFKPYDQWAISSIPAMLQTMWSIVLSKGFFFGLNFILVGFGVAGLLQPSSPFRRFASLAAIVFIGYNLFLMATYIAAFGASNAEGAVSYWRYNTHLGLIGTSAAAVGLAGFVGRSQWAYGAQARRIAWVAPVIALLLPIAFARTLRFDVDIQKIYARQTSRTIAKLMGPNDRLMLIDPRGTGLVGMMIMHELGYSKEFAGYQSAFHQITETSLTKMLNIGQANYYWIYTMSEPVAAVFALPNPAPGSYLVLRNTNGKLTNVGYWPYPANYNFNKTP